jgi:imidazolonepropionase-like amidohydrolase
MTPAAPGTPPGTTPGGGRRGQRPPEEDEEETACCGSDDRSGAFFQDEAPARPESPGAASGGSAAESAELKELRETFEKALAYGRVRDEAKARGARGPDFDPRLEALVPFARGERPIVLTVSDARSIREAVAFAERMKWKVILSGCAEGWKVAKLLAEKKVPCLVGPVLAAPRQSHEPYDTAFHNATVLWKSGVRFAFRTSESSNVRNLPYHAGMAAAFGLPREEALRAVTLSPAEILGVADQLGSLDVGKRADVVVADGDLLEIRTHVKHLFIGGSEVPLDTKHTRLYETYKKRLAAPAPSPASAAPSTPAGAPPSGSGSER